MAERVHRRGETTLPEDVEYAVPGAREPNLVDVAPVRVGHARPGTGRPRLSGECGDAGTERYGDERG
jgi:hypothetical protein